MSRLEVTDDDVRTLVAESRQAQGKPPKITDTATLRAVARAIANRAQDDPPSR
jgi:hypothetical protein